jgi:acyl-CoA oxidase
VRYAAVRRQTAARAGEREVQVLDYQNTAADLLPLVAACYALIFMARAPVGRRDRPACAALT